MDEHYPERLKLIFGSNPVRHPSIGNQKKQGGSPTHVEPPTLAQVPAALPQTPLSAEQRSAQKLELLTPPGLTSMPIPLNGPLPWDKAFECVRNSIANGHTPNAVSFNALISACEKARRVDEALEAFALMQEVGVAPNECTYSVLISACEKERPFMSRELLNDAVRRHVYQEALGYNKKTNEMDFHNKKIQAGEAKGGGVCVPLAQALFSYHLHPQHRKSNFGPGTLFIVGQGGGLINNAIAACIRAENGIPEYQQKEGWVNYGAIYWTTPHQQPPRPNIAPASNTSTQPRLNPDAQEFVPSRQHSLNPNAQEFVPLQQHSLNPNAQEFFPSRDSLNPHAREFVPGQKPQ